MKIMAKRLKPAAKVIKAVGLKGDVKVYPFDGSFEQYVNEKFLYVGDDPTTTQTLQLSAIAKTGKFIRYAVQGNESREDAEDLVGKLIFTPADEDEILPEEIIGFLVVTTEGKPIGILADIMPILDNLGLKVIRERLFTIEYSEQGGIPVRM